MPRHGGVTVRRFLWGVLAVALLTAFLGLVWMNQQLYERARDLDQPMPCSVDNDAACRSGFVR